MLKRIVPKLRPDPSARLTDIAEKHVPVKLKPIVTPMEAATRQDSQRNPSRGSTGRKCRYNNKQYRVQCVGLPPACPAELHW